MPPVAEPVRAADTHAEILQVLTLFALDERFMNSTIEQRKTEILTTLSPLSTEMKNRIFGSIYHHSDDPLKGGPNWGEHHIADSQEVLINALYDVIN
jgi:hypothetical protein